MEICKEYVVKFTREEIKKLDEAFNIISRLYIDFDDKLSSFDGYLSDSVENIELRLRNVVNSISELRDDITIYRVD